jgi:hypothetical protein
MGAGSQDAYLIKVDSFGNLIWERTYGSFWTDYRARISNSSDGGYYAYWNAEDNKQGPGLHPTFEKKTYLVKLNAYGDIVWEKTLMQDFFEIAYVSKLKEVQGGKEIVIAESDEKGELTYYWDKIFK